MTEHKAESNKNNEPETVAYYVKDGPGDWKGEWIVVELDAFRRTYPYPKDDPFLILQFLIACLHEYWHSLNECDHDKLREDGSHPDDPTANLWAIDTLRKLGVAIPKVPNSDDF